MLDNEQLLKVVRFAYKNAKKRGITSERDHFKYLIIVAYWGSYFETDPQYQPLLKQAGWITEDGSISQHTHLPTILREIDKHTISTATDLASFKRISSSLREIYTQPIPKSISPAIMLKIMEYTWPAHLKYGNTQGFINLIKNGISKGKNLKLPTRDTVAYICLSVYFGDRFDESPLFYWVKLALENDGRNIDTRREAFWSGVADYFDKLS